MKSNTDWSLRDAVVGSPVLIRNGRYDASRIQTVTTAGKSKIVLDDGSDWTRAGKKWGSGQDTWGFDPSARLILDLDAVKMELAEERERQQAERDRNDLRRRFGDEIRWLDPVRVAAIIAILDAAKTAREASRASNERGEANTIATLERLQEEGDRG